MANRRRAHAENMKNVERFNEGFQQRFAQGAPSAAVDNYLRSKPVSFFSSGARRKNGVLGHRGTRTGNLALLRHGLRGACHSVRG
jgi:hypothetical protein